MQLKWTASALVLTGVGQVPLADAPGAQLFLVWSESRLHAASTAAAGVTSANCVAWPDELSMIAPERAVFKFRVCLASVSGSPTPRQTLWSGELLVLGSDSATTHTVALKRSGVAADGASLSLTLARVAAPVGAVGTSFGSPLGVSSGARGDAAFAVSDDETDDDEPAAGRQAGPATPLAATSGGELARATGSGAGFGHGSPMLRTPVSALASAGSGGGAMSTGVEDGTASPSMAVGKILESRHKSAVDARDDRAEAYSVLREQLAESQAAKAALDVELAASSAMAKTLERSLAAANAETARLRADKDKLQAAVISVTKLCTEQSAELNGYEAQLTALELELQTTRAAFEQTKSENASMLEFRRGAEAAIRAAQSAPADSGETSELRATNTALERTCATLERQVVFQAHRILALTADAEAARTAAVDGVAARPDADSGSLIEQLDRVKAFRDRLINEWEAERQRTADEHATELDVASERERTLVVELDHARAELARANAAAVEAQETVERAREEAFATTRELSAELEHSKLTASSLSRKIATAATEIEALRAERAAFASADSAAARGAVADGLLARAEAKVAELEAALEASDAMVQNLRVDASQLRLQLAHADKELEVARARIEMAAYSAEAELEQLRQDLQQFEVDYRECAAERRSALAQVDALAAKVTAVQRALLSGEIALPDDERFGAMRTMLELAVDESVQHRDKLAVFESVLIQTKMERAQLAYDLEIAQQTNRKLTSKARRLGERCDALTEQLTRVEVQLAQ